MPTKGEVRAYQATTAALADDAAASFKEIIRAYLRANPGASVAELRDYSIKTVESVCAQYSVASAVVAEDAYESEVGSLPSGRYELNVNLAAIDDAVRYHVGKAADGDVDGFLDSMGSWVSQATFNACNQRTLALAAAGKSAAQRKRERRAAAKAAHKVFFARIPTGVNTCKWCAMLAGRGYVYWTAETAGAYSKWHAHCRCTVVASAKKGGIEGYDPAVWEALSREYEKIEESGLPDVQQKAVKLAYADSLGAYDGSQAELADAYGVAVSSAKRAFVKQRTTQGYKDSIGEVLRLVGEAYGLDLDGETYVNNRGRVVGALPDGDELWAATKAGLSGTFLYAAHEHKCPDMRTQRGLVEIKTPASARKINTLLANAAGKFGAYQGEAKCTLISLMRLPSSAEAALDAASRFEADGAVDHVLVVDGEGALIKK